MDIGKNQNFDDLDKFLKKAIREDFLDYISNDGKHYKRDLTEIVEHLNHQTRCIKKLTTLVKVEQEKSQFLELAIQHQSKQIESICREIIHLKGD